MAHAPNARAFVHTGVSHRPCGQQALFNTVKEGYRRFDVLEPSTRQQANPITTATLEQLRINSHELEGKRTSDMVLPLGIGAQTGLDVGGYRASTEPTKTVYLEAALNF